METEIAERIDAAERRYGDFASTHEALGVLLEEFDELRRAVHSNALESVREECLDIAAVALRMADQCRNAEPFKRRSVK